MYLIEGVVQPYNWGGKTFISGLLGQSNPEGRPYAEYWLGAHPAGPSKVMLGEKAHTSLPALIQSDRERYLGTAVNTQFGRFPYLLKILDVKDMLSIQVHPTKRDAEEGFRKENEAAVPLDAPNRNYKDDNHKPEMMVALSEFWLLHGFSSQIEKSLGQHAFFAPFISVFKDRGIEGLYQTLMELPQQEVDALLQPHAERILPLYASGRLEKTDPDFWAARAVNNLCSDGHLDRGIFSIYLFNIVRLQPGEGIFQGAGLPHAYLEGQNIELMSNSDNVLRAGLTPKYIDIPELLRNTEFVVTIPKIIAGNLNNTVQQYPAEVPDFGLTALHIPKGEKLTFDISSPHLFLSLQGKGQWRSHTVLNTTGLSCLLAVPGEEVEVEATEDMQVFMAFVPQQNQLYTS